jgi:hypothetical protein
VDKAFVPESLAALFCTKEKRFYQLVITSVVKVGACYRSDLFLRRLDKPGLGVFRLHWPPLPASFQVFRVAHSDPFSNDFRFPCLFTRESHADELGLSPEDRNLGVTPVDDGGRA